MHKIYRRLETTKQSLENTQQQLRQKAKTTQHLNDKIEKQENEITELKQTSDKLKKV